VDRLRNLGGTITDEEVIAISLYSLPKEYDALTMTIGAEIDTTINGVIAKLEAQNEKDKARGVIGTEVETALKIRDKNFKFSINTVKKEYKKCTICGKAGHKVDNCWNKNPRKNKQNKTRHMCSNSELFHELKEIEPRDINVANGETIQAIGKGSVMLHVLIDGKRMQRLLI